MSVLPVVGGGKGEEGEGSKGEGEEGGQSPTRGSKKNFPPGNFCMAATGREKIARHCRGTAG